MAGHFVQASGNTFPETQYFAGFMEPCRFEGEVYDLEVIGEIPKEINGTFYRNMPDPQVAPFARDDIWFNGDGNISAFRIKDGHVDFKQRYVRTEKFEREKEARRALIGKYRNPYTDAEPFKIRSTANTNIVYFNGKLLACKEDSPPYAMNPETLETLGVETFNGQLKSETFTAHPKIDAVSGELIGFGYEAKGIATTDICYFSIGPDGVMTEELWFKQPQVSMIHDFAVTENWVVLPLIPHICDMEQLKNGGEHWYWDPNMPIYFAVLPRRGGKPEDVKYFHAPNAFPGHTANAYEDSDGNLLVDLSIASENAFDFFPEKDGTTPDMTKLRAPLKRFTINPHSDVAELPPAKILLETSNEFSRIDDRFATRRYRHVFNILMDPTLETDYPAVMRANPGAFFNGIGHLDLETGKLEKWSAGPRAGFQEPAFIPRSKDAPEGDGFLIVLVNDYEAMRSKLVIIDVNKFQEPVATVKLPLRLRPGLHGNWVDAEDLEK
ncbi:uncharacterized protein NECHADRAFT_42458 [Fusarium vanettenii 77-13-4]|uniref:Dioxygenase n=1 Tax=Fusarium vanettenii (strain ATCC MYA-4622 / CBS 123669 / FGSC 9596 / NRRL 45880 / 77-13-4) TaxID=660122 RepID=C7ZHL6_FUSV7|nr:uncharacterized protein NECHADRAFT_42458 [Fusarium vanettenii 77-13-4]EEU36435.1 hypothetical protein NECHADRAFT_42458 [Fusarium vanettenii 77-13-4]